MSKWIFVVGCCFYEDFTPPTPSLEACCLNWCDPKPNKTNEQTNQQLEKSTHRWIWPGALLCMLILTFTDLLFLFDRLLTHFWHINTCPIWMCRWTFRRQNQSDCFASTFLCIRISSSFTILPFRWEKTTPSFAMRLKLKAPRLIALVYGNGKLPTESTTCCLMSCTHLYIYRANNGFE